MTKASRKPVPAGNRSGCPIATTLDMVGDKWTLVLIRDMVRGKKRFGEFLDSPEGITTNILASRLKAMERQGLIRKVPYQDKPRRFEYALTDRGLALVPVAQAMCRWANAWIPETWVPPEAFMRLRAPRPPAV